MHREQWEEKPVHGRSRPLLLAIGASLCTLTLVMCSPTVSHATQPGKHHHDHRLHDQGHQHHDSVRVPEPSANVLLLLGLGVTGLVSYSVQRRKRGA
jgi:PEP-CTERM motif